MGGAIVILLVWIKILGKQKKTLKEKNEAHEKEDEIADDMLLAKAKEEAIEKDEIDKIDTSDWRGNLND